MEVGKEIVSAARVQGRQNICQVLSEVLLPRPATHQDSCCRKRKKKSASRVLQNNARTAALWWVLQHHHQLEITSLCQLSQQLGGTSLHLTNHCRPAELWGLQASSLPSYSGERRQEKDAESGTRWDCEGAGEKDVYCVTY